MANDLSWLWVPAVAIVAWIAFSAFLAAFGWRELARRCPAGSEPVTGRTVWLGAGLSIGGPFGAQYNGGLSFRIGKEGIRIAQGLPFFLLFHPPVFLPWSAVVECEERRFLFLRRTLIHLHGSPGQIEVRGRAAKPVLAAWREARGIVEATPAPRVHAAPLPGPEDGGFRGVQFLIVLCGLASVLLVVSGATGIASLSSVNGVARHDEAGRVMALVFAVLYGGFAYGVYRRVPLAWRTGFVLLLVSSLPALRLAADEGAPVPARLLSVVGTLAVAAYWGTWWKRQRGYFGG